MNVNLALLGQLVALTSLVFSISLGVMAKRRDLNVSGWFVIGLIPWLNLIGWFVLLFTRQRRSPEIAPKTKPLFRFRS